MEEYNLHFISDTIVNTNNDAEMTKQTIEIYHCIDRGKTAINSITLDNPKDINKLNN